MMSTLKVENFEYYYNNIHAIKGISFNVNEGEIVTIIGANGAGKSTTLKAISGLLDPRGIKGEILLDGEKISDLSGHKIVEKGIIQVLEGRHIFAQLTVEENIRLGAFSKKDSEIVDEIEKIYKRFPRLEERKKQLGGTLSGGEQQMLAIARAIINKPKLLLLDEPSLGLAPIIVKEIFDIIRSINEDYNTTILLVEQNSKMALKVSDRGYVLQNGKIVLEGKSSDLLNDDRVKDAYLGGRK